MSNVVADAREDWVQWLEARGAGAFYDAFVAIAQDAQSTCIHCGESIYLDIVEGGGVPDWCTSDGDYGCGDSPDTDDEGTGGHEATKRVLTT